MRNEKEVFDMILNYAKKNDDIRAVLMNGSRTNPNADKDNFRDYDIVYVVKDPKKYLSDRSFIDVFGKTIIIQQNNLYLNNDEYYIFLMLFEDGVRIDLQFFPLDQINTRECDSLEAVLLDKDNIISELPTPNEEMYYVKKPSKNEFEKTVNNFWWCLNNVVKGIHRDQLCYVKSMYDIVIKQDINKIIDWYIGMNNDWKVNVGLFGKYYKKYLSTDLYELFKKTYANANYDEIWDSIDYSCELLRMLAIPLSKSLSYDYPIVDDIKMSLYLEKMRK
ncbi:aminoglycoside 6-adenylyltransferase [Abyssisolibacter fermentans]|uniref:aminoglycoside 6-adenylyltransferase n=1 Tax=Abyssisolibacter fermentans TaxID=1766203 RepID=UPI000835E57E|nr:aminoglycoside 6-adenylyltransferase [Abyssisolibacter fermentans]